MAEIKDELSEKTFPRVPRLVLLGSASLAAVICAGFVANAMLTRSQLPTSTAPATAQMYVLPEEGASDAAAAPILQADPLPTAEVSPGTATPQAATEVAAIPPKPLSKPAEAKTVAAKPRCEADECVSWETTVNKALAASASPGQARVMPPHGTMQPGGPQPMPAAIEPPMSIPQDEPMLIEREASTVGGMAKSAATSVVTQSGRLVDNMMRWSDKAVTKLVTPPRWASADETPSPTP